MIELIFYTTLGCHLCEDAEALLSPFIAQKRIKLTSVDIADSDELVELYGIRIPVIKRVDNDEELGWPFDDVKLNAFLLS